MSRIKLPPRSPSLGRRQSCAYATGSSMLLGRRRGWRLQAGALAAAVAACRTCMGKSLSFVCACVCVFVFVRRQQQQQRCSLPASWPGRCCCRRRCCCLPATLCTHCRLKCTSLSIDPIRFLSFLSVLQTTLKCVQLDHYFPFKTRSINHTYIANFELIRSRRSERIRRL